MSRDPNHPDDEPTKHPGHFVREWREFMDWSQEELGVMVHAHQTKIARIERGERGLKTGFLKDLARAFGVPQSTLLEVNPATTEGRQTASMLLTWNKLTPSERDTLLQAMEGVAARRKIPDAG